MNKSKYVKKMTDLVEDVLLDKGVSPYYTIEDNWDDAEEDEELSMTLSHDANDEEITFNLAELYAQKREEDVKLKDQFERSIKERMLDWLDREIALELDGVSNRDDYDEDEEDDLDDDDLDDDLDDDDLDDALDEDDEYEDSEDEDEEEEEEEEKPTQSSKNKISAVLAGVLGKLEFEKVNGNPDVKVATLPKGFDGDLSKVMHRYGKQIEDMYDGAYVIKPNKNDVLVLNGEAFDKETVKDILSELYEKGGVKTVITLEAEQERDR